MRLYLEFVRITKFINVREFQLIDVKLNNTLSKLRNEVPELRNDNLNSERQSELRLATYAKNSF
ncbi:MAG: hypothetical protein WBP45_05140 [Daejeonella sp.]